MVKKKAAGKWVIGTLTAVILLLAVFAGICIYVDPFCHYHMPLDGYDYSVAWSDSLYLNAGIAKHYDYDGIITGTSMSENFKTSEAERLFGMSFIKIPQQGGSFKEINTLLELAYASGKNPKYAIRSLDDYAISEDYNSLPHLSAVDYLYNDNVFDDVNYLFNLEMFTRYTRSILAHPLNGGVESSIDFDSYCSWEHPTGKEVVLATYTVDAADEEAVFTPEDKAKLLKNIRFNITDIAYEHPETTFICFFPPYSICDWEIKNGEKSLHRAVDKYRIVAEELLKCPNIKLFAFYDHYDIICDLDNYRDAWHYCADVNSELLKMMANGTSMLTLDNYEDYFNEIERFFSEYDYSWLHE